MLSFSKSQYWLIVKALFPYIPSLVPFIMLKLGFCLVFESNVVIYRLRLRHTSLSGVVFEAMNPRLPRILQKYVYENYQINIINLSIFCDWIL